jgi:hypothetical protein
VSASLEPRRPVSPEWQQECKRFGAWLSGASFVAALAWLTGANALVPLSNGKIIHAPYVGWPLILMIIGMVIGIYTYQAASHERLPIPGRRRVEIDHSYRYSLIFVSPALRWELDTTNEEALGVQVGVKFSNAFNKPIQVYLENLDAVVNGLDVKPYGINAVRKLRIMPTQGREFRLPTLTGFPQGYFVGEVSYSVLYGPLDESTIYRHRHSFRCFVTGVNPTAADIRKNGSGGNDWIDIEPENDSDMPNGYKYPGS